MVLEVRRASGAWLRITSGFLAIVSTCVFAFYGFADYFGYCTDVQMQMIQDTKLLAHDVGVDAALEFLDSYALKIKEQKNNPAAMHSLLLEFERQASELRKNKGQQGSPDNPR